MQELIKQEQFELEILNRLNSKRYLDKLIFVGGTMLRLCFGLNRYSVDLDFWLTGKAENKKLLESLKTYFAQFYEIRDATDKFHTMLIEIKSSNYPRNLKIEIRKGTRSIKTEQAIAYTKYSDTQVLLRVPSLAESMKSKFDAFLERKEIRDIFDIEFLFKKGVDINFSKDKLEKALVIIDSFTKNDYKVKLGSLLEESQRVYYNSENFKIIKSALKEKIK